MKPFLLHLIFLLPLLAEEAPTVSCRFLCLYGEATELSFQTIGEERLTTELPKSRISTPSKCLIKEGKLSFYDPKTSELIAEKAVSQSLRSAILIFFKSSDSNKLPWRIFLLKDSPPHYPETGSFVANFHSADIRFLIGAEKHELAPGKTKALSRPEERDAFNMAPVIFQFNIDDQWRTGSETKLRYTSQSRYLILAHLDPSTKRPRLSTFRDLKPTSPSPATPTQ